MADSGLPWKLISPLVGLYSLASSRATVDLPLPLSPASATISCSPMVRLKSSTACRVRLLDSALPILKCRVRFSVRSSDAVPAWADGAPDSAGAGAGGAAGKAVSRIAARGGWPAAGSVMAWLLPRVQEAPDERAVHLVQRRRLDLAP